MSSGLRSLRRDGPAVRIAGAEAADVQRAGRRGALQPDAVDVVQRLVGERDAVGAADPDPGPGAGGPAALEHLDPGCPAGDQVGELGDGRLLRDLGGIDGRDGVGHLQLALHPRWPWSPVRRAAPAREPAEVSAAVSPAPPRPYRSPACSPPGALAPGRFRAPPPEQETAFPVGGLDPVCSGEHDARGLQRRAVACIGDLAADRGLLGVGARRRPMRQPTSRRGAELPLTNASFHCDFSFERGLPDGRRAGAAAEGSAGSAE